MAWRRLDDAPVEPLPWLIGIARNVRLTLRRALRRREALSRRLVETAPREPEPAATTESELVRRALARLSATDREILLLSIWDDLDREAIALALGQSKANVSVRLHRARRRFAAALTEEAAPRAAPTVVPGGAPDAC